jgi:hypothetical protein
MTRFGIIALLGSGLLAGCAFGGGGRAESTTDAATRVACRQRAEQVYSQQNRAEIYSPPAAVNTPFSAGYAPGVSDRGLSDLYAHDRMVDDCIRNTGTGEDRSAAPSTSARP